MIDVVGRKTLYLSISGALVLLAIVAIAIFGFRPGIDFEGGTLWHVRMSPAPALSDLGAFMESKLEITAAINRDEANDAFLVRLPPLDEPTHERYRTALAEEFEGFSELSFQSIGPSIGEALKKNALIAIVLVLVGISLYIAFAFRKVSRPISSWKYGVITLLTLLHDVVIPAGLLAFLGYARGIEIDSNFIVALLVVMGFSVHDTIVVFDRIRENLSHDRGRTDFGAVINQSINQTMHRSIYTSLTLILVLIALIVVGPPTLMYFVLTLLVGVTLGTYSSIFVASPALLLVSSGAKKR